MIFDLIFLEASPVRPLGLWSDGFLKAKIYSYLSDGKFSRLTGFSF